MDPGARVSFTDRVPLEPAGCPGAPPAGHVRV